VPKPSCYSWSAEASRPRATFAIGPVLTESKVGAPSTIAGGPLAMIAALLLGRERRTGG
jgi:hypothetical protein